MRPETLTSLWIASGLALIALLCGSTVSGQPAPTGRAFYVDPDTGRDDSDGSRPERAWKTLAPANAHTFVSGDSLLLRAGTRLQGPLALHGSGTAGAPIVVDRYGVGPKPCIAAEPSDAVLEIYNGEHWDVRNLELTGGRIGVFAYAKDFGATHGLHFRRLWIHNIEGSTTGDDGGFLCKREGLDTWFDDLLIEGCTIEHADRNGILLTDYPTASDKHHSKRVVIRGNRLRDIGGDGIFILGCDGAIIENNVLRYAHQRVGRRPGERACAGIWPHRCNDTLIQFNEVSHTAVGGQTVWDSEAFDDDISCTGTVFQYNYSHDNAGGFLLICGGNGTIARYNVSQNDATATFTLETDGTTNVSIYNNTCYIAPGMDVSFARNTMGTPRGIRFTNNIIYANGAMTYQFGAIEDLAFDHNAFCGEGHVKPPLDPHALTQDPLLVKPGGGGNGISSVGGYRLRADSPCHRAGKPMPRNGGRDFWGQPLSGGQSPAIGACER